TLNNEITDRTLINGLASVTSDFEVSGTSSISAFSLVDKTGAAVADCEATTDKLVYDSGTKRFGCGVDQNTVGSSGISSLGVREGDAVAFSHITSISFTAGSFIVNNTGSQSYVYLDYANGPASLSQDETVSGLWRFTGGASFSTSATTRLNIEGMATGATDGSQVAGILASYSFTNAITDGFTFGNRFITTINNSSAASGSIGTLIRMKDDSSSIRNTVRGLEVQAWSGSNVSGVNTGVATFGKTFGLHAVTDAIAGGKVQPAAIFADLSNQTAKSAGNALRAYSSYATTADLVLILQASGSYAGDALSIDMASGSVNPFSGNFLKARSQGTTYSHLDAEGNLFVSLTAPGSSGNGLCHVTNGAVNNDEIIDCTSNPGADYMEMYPTAVNTEDGDILVASLDEFAVASSGGRVARLIKSSVSYDPNIIGIVSVASEATDFNSIGYNIKEGDNPQPIALSGRVKVKVSLENGPIKVGDRVTTSSVPGVGMKATKFGMAVGIALEPLDSLTPNTYEKIMVFVNTGLWIPPDSGLADAQADAAAMSQDGWMFDLELLFKAMI
ncbi:MAG: hypothetical protein Q7R31_02525, partial [Candidatus Levybacteria bacterium]|nr:hypothetical protein [Candidatus Levybacteria bacterium]